MNILKRGSLTLWVFFFLITSSSALADAGISNIHKVDPQTTGLQSAADAFPENTLKTTLSWRPSGFLNGIQPGISIPVETRRRILAILNREGDFAFLPILDFSHCEVWIRTMNFGAPEVTQLLLELRHLGVGKIRIIAHGPEGFRLKNRAATGAAFRGSALVPKQKTRPEDRDGMGDAVAALLKDGFVVNPTDPDAPYQILISEVRSGMQPLMHEKGDTVIVRAKKQPGLFDKIGHFSLGRTLGQAVALHANPFERLYDAEKGEGLFHVFKTANLPKVDLTPDHQPDEWVFNRSFEIVLRELLEVDHDHTVALAEALRTTGKISAIAAQRDERHTFQFADGSFIQMQYTNGRDNPNDRKRELHERAMNNPNFKILKIYDSQYSFVEGADIESLRKLFQKFPELTMTAIYDRSFISPRHSGVPAVFVGLPAQGDDGLHEGFAPELRSRIQAQVFRRLPSTGARFRGKVLWHDKTRIYLVNEDGVEWMYIFTGSFNGSSRSVNAEWQLQLKVPANSAVAKYFVDSIVSQPNLKSDLFAPLAQEIFITALTDYIGVSPGDVSRTEVAAILAELKANNFDSVQRRIEAIYRDDNVVKKTREKWTKGEKEEIIAVNAQEIRERMKFMRAVFDWWYDMILTKQRPGLINRVLTHLIVDQIPLLSADNFCSFEQLTMLLTSLTIERTHFLKTKEKQMDFTETSDSSRARIYYMMKGASEDERLELCLSLFNVIRNQVGLPVESADDFKRNLAIEMAAPSDCSTALAAVKTPARRHRTAKKAS